MLSTLKCDFPSGHQAISKRLKEASEAEAKRKKAAKDAIKAEKEKKRMKKAEDAFFLSDYTKIFCNIKLQPP